MKKLLVILFALGLVFSFTAPVMATDVSFDGSFRVRGFYDSNPTLKDTDAIGSAYYDQRFRLKTVFQVVEGLKVTARFDALDGTWGTKALRNARVATTTYGALTTADNYTSQSQGNLQFDMAYVTFMTAIGQFEAGYMSDGVWGTGFGDYEVFNGTIMFQTKIGNLGLTAKTVKDEELDKGTTTNDKDTDSYVLGAVYQSDGIDAGILYKYKRIGYVNSAAGRLVYGGDRVDIHAVAPYVKATIGDLYIESELTWADGEVEQDAVKQKDLEALTFYAKAQYNMGPVYLGALFAFVQGDDALSTGVKENAIDSGSDWDPMLILFNDTCPTALGRYATAAAFATTGGTTMTGTAMDNGFIYQVFAGAAFDKLSLKATLSIAEAHEDTYGTLANLEADKYAKDYGTEFDVTASYKIYDNLTYTVGAGYLWAGDYYKGSVSTNKVGDTYLLMNKLQVTF